MKIAPLVLPLALLSTVANAQDTDATMSPPPVVQAPESRPSVRAEPVDEDDFDGPQPRLNRLTVGPLTVFAGALTLEYERALTENISVFAGPRIGFTGLGLGASVGARFFPLSGARAPDGLWVGPELFAEYAQVSGSVGNERYANTRMSAIALGMVGYTHTFDMGLTFSVGGGAGGGYISAKGTTALASSTGGLKSTPFNSAGFVPSLAINANVGWAF